MIPVPRVSLYLFQACPVYHRIHSFHPTLVPHDQSRLEHRPRPSPTTGPGVGALRVGIGLYILEPTPDWSSTSTVSTRLRYPQLSSQRPSYREISPASLALVTSSPIVTRPRFALATRPRYPRHSFSDLLVTSSRIVARPRLSWSPCLQSSLVSSSLLVIPLHQRPITLVARSSSYRASPILPGPHPPTRLVSLSLRLVTLHREVQI